MNTRERFHALMNFKPFDRLPLVEWAGWWDKTIERWHSEELPTAITDRYDIARHFGLDIYRQDWFSVAKPGLPKPAAHGAGIIADEKGYNEVRHLLYPETPIYRDKWRQWAEEQKRGETVLWFTVDGFFWFARKLLGIERHLYAFYDQPELMHRINSDLADWLCVVIDEVSAVCTPDFMTFAEDLSYNHGPMLSQDLYDQFMKPYYARIVPRLRNHGILSIVDSDGDIAVPASWFEASGLDGILPLERQAGNDMNELRRRHPRMRFIGHFDKMTMNRGEAAMRAEFERLLPVASKGGFIISCDHQTPPGVSYRDYQLYLKLFREYGERAGTLSRS